jgi:prophage antirepressor-like protein
MGKSQRGKQSLHPSHTFNFNGHDLRVTKSEAGQPWFVAHDIAHALGYRDARDAIRHVDESERGTHIVRTPGGDQKMITVDEAGLYALIMLSRKPAAKAFSKWVRSEVLPSIRKTGAYAKPGIFKPNQPPAHTESAQSAPLLIANHSAPQTPACEARASSDPFAPGSLPPLPQGLDWPAGLELQMEARANDLAFQSLPAFREYVRRHMATSARNERGWVDSHVARAMSGISLHAAFAYQEAQAISDCQSLLLAMRKIADAGLRQRAA